MTFQRFSILLLILPMFSVSAADFTAGLQLAQTDKSKESTYVDQRKMMQKGYQQSAPSEKEELPSYKMLCLPHSNVELALSSPTGKWQVTPSSIKPETFGRAYGKVDENNNKKVTLACLYRINTSITTTLENNGKQKCAGDPATGKAQLNYSAVGMDGYTPTIEGTSAKGKLNIVKTGQKIEKDTLICEYKIQDLAQFFKKHTSDMAISGCRGNSLNVKCR